MGRKTIYGADIVREKGSAQHKAQNQTQNGPMHLVIGMAGFKHDTDFIAPQPEPLWACADDAHYGFASLEFANAPHMKGRFLENWYGDTVDEWHLVRDPTQRVPNTVSDACRAWNMTR